MNSRPLRLLLVLLSLGQACAGPRTEFRPGESTALTDEAGLALGGHDPVSYFDAAGPVPGSADHEFAHEGVRYRFASPANRDRFAEDPARFLPEFGGYCAWAVADGEGSLVEVDPRSFLIQDGRLLLFYDGLLADTRALWLERDMGELLESADANWRRLTAE